MTPGLSTVRCSYGGVDTHPPDEGLEAQERLVTLGRLSLCLNSLKVVLGSLRDGGASPLPLRPLGKMKPPTVTGGGRVMWRESRLGIRSWVVMQTLLWTIPSSVQREGGRGVPGFPWLQSACAATTMHLAACYPVCCPPPHLAPARPPAQNRKGKEVISTGSSSPAGKALLQ